MGFRRYRRLTGIKNKKRLFACLIRPFHEDCIFNFGSPFWGKVINSSDMRGARDNRADILNGTSSLAFTETEINKNDLFHPISNPNEYKNYTAKLIKFHNPIENKGIK